MHDRTHRTIGIYGQIIGLIFLGIGIGIEIALKADFGFLAITLGSVAFAIATKVRHG